MATAPATTFERDDWSPFRCDVAPERDAVRVVPCGELDIATTPQLERQLRELHEAGFRRIVLDLRGLRFMDSTGLRLIMGQDALARADGHAFTLVAGPPAVQRIFELACVLDRLDFRAG
jgi:anti-sigma B factor antagonist